MSIPSEETREQREGGFTVVFRLARAKPLRATAAAALQRRTQGLAKQLIAGGRAQAVLGSEDRRDVMQEDPILSGVYVLSAGTHGSTSELLEGLEADDAVELAYVAPPRDILVTRRAFVSGTGGGNNAWHTLIKLAQAQKLPQWAGKGRVPIAAVDSGVDIGHQQLTQVDLEEYLGRPPRRPDMRGHGTHISGLIGAQPHAGNSFKGIAADCVDLTMCRGMARPSDTAAYYRAMRAATGARIINLSVGGEEQDPIETDIVRDALEDERRVVVAAMGNSREMGSPTIYPAALDGVIAVGAVDANGQCAPFSNSGDHIMLAAPGVDIMSTVPTYPVPVLRAVGTPPLGALSGTSMATPIVSALIGRMVSFRPSLTRMQVIDLIRTCLGRLWNPDTGHGILDAHALLSAL